MKSLGLCIWDRLRAPAGSDLSTTRLDIYIYVRWWILYIDEGRRLPFHIIAVLDPLLQDSPRLRR